MSSVATIAITRLTHIHYVAVPVVGTSGKAVAAEWLSDNYWVDMTGHYNNSLPDPAGTAPYNNSPPDPLYITLLFPWQVSR